MKFPFATSALKLVLTHHHRSAIQNFKRKLSFFELNFLGPQLLRKPSGATHKGRAAASPY
jgi:hypothetical protein